jgi:hypothetical protein
MSCDPPQYLPQQPEVAGFKRYGDIPVGEYTGIPDVSIPLYTVRLGSLELPITLSYHASGIKVEQEASWVGLGWDLLAGGVIALEPVSSIDEIGNNNRSYYNYYGDPQKLQHFKKLAQQWHRHSGDIDTNPRYGIEDGLHLWGCYNSQGNENDSENSTTRDDVLKWGLAGAGERDVFNVSLPDGNSFKFIRNPVDETPLIIGKSNNYEIQYNHQSSITVVDDEGTKYRYEPTDYYSIIPLCYRLRSIVSRQQDTIRLTYTTIHERSVPYIFETYVDNKNYRNNMPEVFTTHRIVSNDVTTHSTAYLSSIESNTEIVFFELGTRQDRIGTSAKLLSMSIKNKLTSKDIFSYVFDYDYFTGIKKGGDYLSAEESNYGSGISEDARRKRLKLVSLSKNAYNYTGEQHRFTYNDSIPLPYKTSFARDYWGYYNGAENASTLVKYYKHTLLPIPDNRFNSSFSNDMDEYPAPGANRNSSPNFITAGMLKSITYPTGGSVEFEFEPHTFNNHRILSKEAVDAGTAFSYLYVSDYTAEGANQSENFTLLHRQTVRLNVAVYFGNKTAYQLNGSGANIFSIGPNGSTIVKSLKITNEDCFRPDPITDFNRSDTITLDPGNYVLVVGTQGGIVVEGYHPRTLTTARLDYRAYPFDYNAYPSIGGGVRIKKIIKKDYNDNIMGIINYRYENIDGKTSGKLLVPAQMTKWVSIKHVPEPNFLCNGQEHSHQIYNLNFYLVSSNYMSVLPSTRSALLVGYDRVIKEVSSANQTSNGSVASEFSNTGATLSSITWGYESIEFPPNNNGSLVKQQIYDTSYILQQEKTWNYEITDIQ